MKIIQQSWKKIALIVFLAALSGVGVWHYYRSSVQQQDSITILDFSDQRDTKFILDIFERDWWWLVSENSTDFSAEYFLEHQGHRGNEGQTVIKVAYAGDKPVGFTAYYKENFYRGRILFIDVIPDVRSKGVGYKLFDYAVKDLKQRGATKIVLLTRTTNEPAQKLYKRYGFTETSRSDGFVDFEYDV